MFTMEPRADAVRFEYNGKHYAMTEEEIEAAYRYQRHQYLRQDAKDALDYAYNLGLNPPYTDEKDADRRFEEHYKVRYSDALDRLDDLVELKCKWGDWATALTLLADYQSVTAGGDTGND